MGPIIAIPIGRKTRDPNQSYALTRDSTSEGISRCIVVVQSVPNMVNPIPATKLPTPITRTGARTARAISGQTDVSGAIVAVSSGLAGFQRNITTLPRTAPTPSSARMRPQAGAPPRDCLAMTGPRTNIGAKINTFTHENSRTMTQSQVRDQNSVQPLRNCSTNVSTDSPDTHSMEI